MSRLSPRPAMLPLALAASIFYMARSFWPEAPLFASFLGSKAIDAIGCLLKFLCLALGAVYGLRVAARLESDNPSRRAWRWLGLGIAGFAVGQVILSFYLLGLGRSPPLPSVGDPPFLAGYALMIAATVEFVRVYFATGFPVGSPRALGALAVAGAVGFTLLGFQFLRPIAAAPVPLAERAINLAYPILDFVALIPALVLVRITIAFRGGGVFRVWCTLLAGWVFTATGDVLFAYLSSAEVASLMSAVDLTLLLGYLFLALGTMLELELLDAPVPSSRVEG